VPLGDFPDVDMVKVAFEPVVETGLNEAAALAGNPLAVNVTDPRNPFSRVIVTL
jgi:hypothetical protein